MLNNYKPKQALARLPPHRQFKAYEPPDSRTFLELQYESHPPHHIRLQQLVVPRRETHEDEMLKMKMKVVSMSEVSSRMMPPEVRVQGEEDGGVVRTRFLCLIKGRNQTGCLLN
ncbi:hypothetical protein E3N88_13012 [Mikania micrantha]|uniref:Uncharacterized protein n=1 Tax=Mikania micrantha TaxID=192012 RepID=A0A5N6P7J6_9ASTR|nr:hypothetical protein E3N88_13012 [Mikania micrantha]